MYDILNVATKINICIWRFNLEPYNKLTLIFYYKFSWIVNEILWRFLIECTDDTLHYIYRIDDWPNFLYPFMVQITIRLLIKEAVLYSYLLSSIIDYVFLSLSRIPNSMNAWAS